MGEKKLNIALMAKIFPYMGLLFAFRQIIPYRDFG